MKLLLPITLCFMILNACKGDPGILQIDSSHQVIFLDSISASKEINEDEVNGFFQNISIVDMSIQMKQNCKDQVSCIKSYQEFLAQDVEDFTEDETAILKEIYKKAYDEIKKVNQDILPAEVQLIKTKAKHYGPSVYYTRENIIVIPKNELVNPNPERMISVAYHELFHIISRYNPGLKNQLYGLIGFNKLEASLEIPPPLKKRLLLNPDGIDMEYVISLNDTINSRTFDAIPIIVSSEEEFKEEKQAFFAYLKFSFYEVEHLDGGLRKIVCDEKGFSNFSFSSAGNFYSQIQDNTGYIIHPDEIMADNFTLVFTKQTPESRANLSEGGKLLLEDVKTTLATYR